MTAQPTPSEAAQPAEPTHGPWEWSIQDHSMAILHGPDLLIDHVLSVGPCPACTKRAEDGKWKWGRCMTPTEANARLIAAAPETAAERDKLRQKLIASGHRRVELLDERDRLVKALGAIANWTWIDGEDYEEQVNDLQEFAKFVTTEPSESPQSAGK